MSRILFQSKDGVALVGELISPAGAKRAVLLFHMMPADRHSWSRLQAELAEHEVASLAVDFRGHGESLVQDGRKLDYRTFSDAHHRRYMEDAEASMRYLEIHGFSPTKIGVCGASIGGSVALTLAAQNQTLPCVALLSPGQNYRGLYSFAAVEQLLPTQSLWMAASQGDDQESFDDAKEMLRRAPCVQKELVPFASSGHGTNLFTHHPDLPGMIAGWLAQYLPA
jgi:pimeloyl-ACP methyl ester carboxylesterase